MCEYCDVKNEFYKNDELHSTKSFEGYYEDANIVKSISKHGKLKNSRYYLLVMGDGWGYTVINFCPMCGRKLGADNE